MAKGAHPSLICDNTTKAYAVYLDEGIIREELWPVMQGLGLLLVHSDDIQARIAVSIVEGYLAPTKGKENTVKEILAKTRVLKRDEFERRKKTWELMH